MGDFPGDLVGGMAKCPLCERKYKKENATVLEIGPKRNTIHFTCDSCKVSSMMFLSYNQTGVVGVGILTDLIKDEAKRLFIKEPISTDQVLEVYKFFKNYK